MKRPVYKYIPRAHSHMYKQNCRNRHVATNIINTENGYELQLALPGVMKDNVEIFVEEGILTIKSKNTEKAEEMNYRLKQFDFSDFIKKFELPEDIDTDKVTANFNEGVLKINLEKVELDETEIKKNIEVK